MNGTARVYFYDEEPERSRRAWRELLPEGAASVADLPPHDAGAVRDGVLVVHGFDRISPNDQQALLQSLTGRNLHLVVVSGGFAQLVEDGDRVYRRKTAVAGPSVLDESFRRCFAEFFAEFRDGRINFSLLEPPDTHWIDRLEALCAGYVLAVIGDAGKDAPPPAELLPAVATLGLDPVGRSTDAVRAKLAGYRAWFETPGSWRGVLGGDVEKFGMQLAGEMRRRHGNAALPSGIGQLLDALKTAPSVAPADVAAAVRDMPHLAGRGVR